MDSMNIIIQTGNVGRIDPGITMNGKQVANFSIAKDFGGKRLWLEIKAWEKVAEEVYDKVSIGDLILIKGHYGSDYSDDPKPVIIADSVQVLLTKELWNSSLVKNHTNNNIKKLKNIFS